MATAAEAKYLASLAVPVACQLLLDKFVQIVAVISVGRLGAAELAAASLGASLASRS